MYGYDGNISFPVALIAIRKDNRDPESFRPTFMFQCRSGPMERDMLTQAGLGERIGNIIEYKLI